MIKNMLAIDYDKQRNWIIYSDYKEINFININDNKF